jgi:phenylacetate-CoA ligase
MGKFDIEQYQIIQEDANSITCKIVKGKTYTGKDEKFITDSFYSHVGKINIDFDYVDSIPTTGAGKYKFIINKLE